MLAAPVLAVVLIVATVSAAPQAPSGQASGSFDVNASGTYGGGGSGGQGQGTMQASGSFGLGTGSGGQASIVGGTRRAGHSASCRGTGGGGAPPTSAPATAAPAAASGK